MSSKRVLLIIIDALSSEYTLPALRSGRLPILNGLASRGILREESVSIFPSLTPAATSTIATGEYPRAHGVFGFHWFSKEEGEEAYHGDDFWVIANMGFANFFEGCLQKLNGSRLKAPTIFQRLTEMGKRSACLNFLIYKGDVSHDARVPAWFNWHPDIPKTQTVSGPELLYFGDLVDSGDQLAEDSPEREGGLLGRFGFNDDNTGRLLEHFADLEDKPDFTLAYFPDHDYQAHEVGLEKAIKKVEKVDKYLERFVLKCGGLDKLLEDYAVVVTGDHSQSDVFSEANRAAIRLDQILPKDSVDKAGKWEDRSKLKVCPDMRCAQLYTWPGECCLSGEELKTSLLREPRIDQLIMASESDEFDFEVHTADRGELKFSRSEGQVLGRDVYGNGWVWEGSLDAVGATIEDGVVHYHDYPNALERIATCVGLPSAGDYWVTAKLGHEFALKETSVHVGGGSHGSLHRLDSLSPLIAAGLPSEVQVPKFCRLVDVAPLCLDILSKTS